MTRGSAPPALLERREHDCRLAPDRWLTTLDEARSFLGDRGLLSITPGCWLPSLFGACPPNPDPGARGFAAMPVHRWWWPGALSELPGVQRTKLLRGKVLLMEDDLFRAIAPLCVTELARAEQGAYGTDGQQLVAYLDQQGPRILGQARDALGWASRSMARVRQQLEAVGAVISEDVELPATNGGHIHTSRLMRVDQCLPLFIGTADVSTAHRQLLAAAVRAAVVAPRDDVERWFAWPAQQVITELIDDGTLVAPARGWLATKSMSGSCATSSPARRDVTQAALKFRRGGWRCLGRGRMMDTCRCRRDADARQFYRHAQPAAVLGRGAGPAAGRGEHCRQSHVGPI